MRQRDTQRSRVYASDKALIEIAKPLPAVRDLEHFVRKVFASKRVKDAFPSCARWETPEVRDGRGRRRACGSATGISMPLWARNEAIALHELAHTICQREHGYKVAAHGWEYCEIYLRITLYVMGREAHDVLKAAFKINRVRFTAPRKGRRLTSEQRAAAIARLSVYNGTAATEPVS